MLNVALIGFGLSGRYLQAPFFIENPNFLLKTIVTNSQNPTHIFPSVTWKTSFEEVIADKSIDLVSICTPSATHFEYAQKALLAGKHVLVEKPMTATSAQAEELINIAKKQGKILTIYQNRRFDSDFKTVKKIVENGFLGEIHTFEAHYNRYKPVLNPKRWKEVASPANGILYDLGAHIIDQTLVLFGLPKSVSGEVFTQREGSEIDDAFDIRLDYDKLRVTLKSSLLIREDTPRYIIHGNQGSFIKYGIDCQEDHLKLGISPRNETFGIEPKENWGTLNTDIGHLHFTGKIETEKGSWMELFQNLYEAIKEGKELIIKPELVLEQIRIIEQIKKT
jgi:scyllo-inositol 2-dehydrogenase (NADP+)